MQSTATLSYRLSKKALPVDVRGRLAQTSIPCLDLETKHTTSQDKPLLLRKHFIWKNLVVVAHACDPNASVARWEVHEFEASLDVQGDPFSTNFLLKTNGCLKSQTRCATAPDRDVSQTVLATDWPVYIYWMHKLIAYPWLCFFFILACNINFGNHFTRLLHIKLARKQKSRL